MSRVRENRTHGSTGGDWKRSTLAREAKKNSRAGNSSAHMASRPTAKICHRASPRPYIEGEATRALDTPKCLCCKGNC